MSILLFWRPPAPAICLKLFLLSIRVCPNSIHHDDDELVGSICRTVQQCSVRVAGRGGGSGVEPPCYRRQLAVQVLDCTAHKATKQVHGWNATYNAGTKTFSPAAGRQ
jgi:hypothetical protein